MKYIGVYTFCNTGSVLVHKIDYADDRVLASINGVNPGWYEIEYDEELNIGFRMGDWFIPFNEVMRI